MQGKFILAVVCIKNNTIQPTTAHEENSSGLPKQMDLFNNQKGREKAINMSFNFFTSDSDIADSILIEVYVGHLRFILNGVLTPTD